jgi:hypothetical protein
MALPGCKNFGIPNYDLTVVLDEGVMGSPEPGVYSHKDIEVVEYTYKAINDNLAVEVFLNGSSLPSEGTFTMYNNLELFARVLDIRGEWTFELVPGDAETEDDYIKFNAVFDGGDDLVSGTFSDNRGYNGTWSIENRSLTMIYTDWFNYILQGGVSSTMQGGYAGENKIGNWTAVRATEGE